MKNKDYARLQKTIELAGTSNYTKHDGTPIKMGAKIYDGKVCIADGTNSNKTHPMQKKYNTEAEMNYKIRDYIHAEMDSLIKASKVPGIDFSKCTIYIARQMNVGTGIAAPCPACRAAIKRYGIKKIVYTNYDGFIAEHITEGD